MVVDESKHVATVGEQDLFHHLVSADGHLSSDSSLGCYDQVPSGVGVLDRRHSDSVCLVQVLQEKSSGVFICERRRWRRRR